MGYLSWFTRKKTPPAQQRDHFNASCSFCGRVHEFDMKQAIDVHHAWYTQLQILLNVEKTDIPKQLLSARDNVCALGQWIHGEARACYAALPQYDCLVESHAMFHTSAYYIVQQYRAGRTEQARQLLETDLKAYSERVQLDIVRLYAALSKEVEA